MNSEPEDLLGKADALMARHRPARGASYGELSLLGEAVQVQAENDDLPLLTEVVAPDAIELARTAPEALQPELQEQQFEALAAGMRAVLLAALQPEIDTLIEARRKERIAPLVEELITALRGELQLIAHDTLREAIDTAVERELERRKPPG